MNAIEELNSKIEILHKELDNDFVGQKFICYQHKKILLHFLEMMTAITIPETKDRFALVKDSYAGFNDALIQAQNMGERMEKGLRRREQIMNDSQNIEYKKLKK